jgi:hypothetical protein
MLVILWPTQRIATIDYFESFFFTIGDPLFFGLAIAPKGDIQTPGLPILADASRMAENLC